MLARTFARRGRLQFSCLQKARYSLSLRDELTTARLPNDIPSDFSPEVKQTTLPSGVRVISVDQVSSQSSVSLYLKAGSRYGSYETQGAGHFLKYFALQNTASKSALRNIRDLEHIGAAFESDFGREHIVHHTTFPRDGGVGLDVALESVQSFLSPQIQEYEFKAVRGYVANDLEKRCTKYTLVDIAHGEAFRDQGLGQHLFALPHSVESVDSRVLHKFLSDNVTAANVTIVGTGVNHQQLVDRASRVFADVKLEGRFYELKNSTPLVTEKVAQTTNWTGGEVRRQTGGETAVLVAYPAPHATCSDNAAYIVLKTYLELQGVSTLFVSYADAGFFAVYGKQGKAAEILNSLTGAVAGASSLTEENFALAKAAAIVQENHAVFNRKYVVGNLATAGIASRAAQLASVSAKQVVDAAKALAKAKPVVVATGDVRGLPRLWVVVGFHVESFFVI